MMYSLFTGDTFFKTDWNHEFNSNQKDREKIVVKYKNKQGKTINKVVELENEEIEQNKHNPNLKIKDRIFEPYLMNMMMEKLDFKGKSEVKAGKLKMELNGVNILPPIKLKIFGDLDVDWVFESEDEIVFKMEAKAFKGNMVGSLINGYILLDLIENEYRYEYPFGGDNLPYNLEYSD